MAVDLVLEILIVALFCWTGWVDRNKPFESDKKEGTHGTRN